MTRFAKRFKRKGKWKNCLSKMALYRSSPSHREERLLKNKKILNRRALPYIYPAPLSSYTAFIELSLIFFGRIYRGSFVLLNNNDNNNNGDLLYYWSAPVRASNPISSSSIVLNFRNNWIISSFHLKEILF